MQTTTDFIICQNILTFIQQIQLFIIQARFLIETKKEKKKKRQFWSCSFQTHQLLRITLIGPHASKWVHPYRITQYHLQELLYTITNKGREIVPGGLCKAVEILAILLTYIQYVFTDIYKPKLHYGFKPAIHVYILQGNMAQPIKYRTVNSRGLQVMNKDSAIALCVFFCIFFFNKIIPDVRG